jgi:hypothetical protein
MILQGECNISGLGSSYGLEWFSVKLIGYLETDNINVTELCFIVRHMKKQNPLHPTLPGMFLSCVFLFAKCYVSTKLTFQLTVN